MLQNAQVARGCGPFVRKTTGDLARGGTSTEVNSHEDLTARRVRKSSHHGIERRQLFIGFQDQTGSTSQMVSSSRTGPIGSQTAIISGVWCATSLDLPSFHTKYSMKSSRCFRIS